MQKLADKLVLFLLGAALLLRATAEGAIAYLLAALILACVGSYFMRPGVTLGVAALFWLLCALNPIFLFFAPLILYDLCPLPQRALIFAFLIPWLQVFRAGDWLTAAMPPALTALAALLQSRSDKLIKAQKALLALMDESRETSLLFAARSEALLEKQDYDVRLATLTERNRIARDIHDSVGHLLSRALLQVGALSALPPGEARAGLSGVKDTLGSAMNAVRESVHDLHEQSIDLPAQLEGVCKAFTFCPATLHLSLEGAPPPPVKLCVIAVVKEALSNVQRHSRATRVDVRVREHPGFYQLTVSDNGAGAGEIHLTGLGLKSIQERALSLGGQVRFIHENGFTVFLTLPKAMPKGDAL